MDEIKERFKDVNLLIGDTVMTQYKAKSSHMNKRAKELNEFLQREDIDIVIPPWGGELAIEVIDKIDYANIQPKWIMGYSDTSPQPPQINFINGAYGIVDFEKGKVTQKFI